MPHCFIHMSSRVRTYFWAAGADSAMDVAGWWASPGEVRADGHRLGWSEADVEAATFAWLDGADVLCYFFRSKDGITCGGNTF